MEFDALVEERELDVCPLLVHIPGVEHITRQREGMVRRVGAGISHGCNQRTRELT